MSVKVRDSHGHSITGRGLEVLGVNEMPRAILRDNKPKSTHSCSLFLFAVHMEQLYDTTSAQIKETGNDRRDCWLPGSLVIHNRESWHYLKLRHLVHFQISLMRMYRTQMKY